MKIIALLPFKNEGWVLPSYVSSISRIADEIIALDDGSTDGGAQILKAAGVNILTLDTSSEKLVNMSTRRQALLDAGRAAGGTHFICLDADEVFSSDFTQIARQYIEKLTPGQKLTLRWAHAWKNDTHYLNDARSPFGFIWKDFIWYDDKQSNFEKRFLSEARTPGNPQNTLKIPNESGVVVHWQFANWDAVQAKQAWYRCTELIEDSRSARRINNAYSITLDNPQLTVTQIPEKWLLDVTKPGKKDTALQLAEIRDYFDTYGILLFEPLQVWYIPELRKLFIDIVGREPKSKTFPTWLVKLNQQRYERFS